MGRMRSRTRLLQALIGLQALLVASPIATIDNLLTSPRAVGAQGRRADLPATIASGLPFVVALLPVTMVAVAVALHRRIAYVPGDVTLWPNLTGMQAIDFLARLRGAGS